MRGLDWTPYDLALLAGLSVLSAWGAWALNANRFPLAKFRSERPPREPALWGTREIALVLLFWIAANVFFEVAFSLGAEGGVLGRGLRFSGLQLAVAGAVFYALRAAIQGTGQPPSVLGFARASAGEIVAALVLWCLTFFPLRAVHFAWVVLLTALGATVETQPLVESFREVVREGAWGVAACYAVPGVLVAPIVEEALFRGFLYGGLRRSLGPFGGALASSAIFAALHLSLSASATILVMGFILSYLYERTGSLYPCMAFHGLFNAATYIALAAGAA